MSTADAEDREARARTDAERVRSEYQREAARLPARESGTTASRDGAAGIPADFHPAWVDEMRRPVFPDGKTQSYRLEDLLLRALRFSSRIRVLSDAPLISETGVREAGGDFDTLAFVEAKYTETHDPLAIDQPPTTVVSTGTNYTTREATVEGGLTKKLSTGTQISLTEDLTRLSGNSGVIQPNPQGNAQLTLSVMQPLLRGAGVAYNLATLRIARLDSQIARAQFLRESETLLVDVNRAYWDLYFARAVFQERKRLVEQTETIVTQSEARKDVDVPQSQIYRAHSALAERKADLIRSEAAIRNAQDRLVTLVNDPSLVSQTRLELIPDDPLLLTASDAFLNAATHLALLQRTEIDQGFSQIRQAAIRENVARSDVLPTLNLVVGGYLSGIKGDGDVLGAFAKQNQDGNPGVLAGLRFQFPLENNAARARLDRTRLETRQRLNELRLTIETIMLEVKGAVREVNTSFRDMQAKYESAHAAAEDLRNLEARRSLILGFDEVSAINYIEYFLDSQERESRAQEALISTVTGYRVALVELDRAKGSLLSYGDFHRQQASKTALPTLTSAPTKPLFRASAGLRDK